MCENHARNDLTTLNYSSAEFKGNITAPPPPHPHIDIKYRNSVRCSSNCEFSKSHIALWCYRLDRIRNCRVRQTAKSIRDASTATSDATR